MIGQKRITCQLDIILESSIKRNSPLGHILISGSPGLGKTTIVEYIAKKAKLPYKVMNGTTISSKMELITALLSCPPSGIIFIDEIHAIPKNIIEVLLTAMEGGRVSVPNGKESVNVDLDGFTIVGATTNPGKIIKPILDRFKDHFRMEQYSIPELTEIVKWHIGERAHSVEEGAAEKIASVCLGVPRNAVRILNRAIDLATIHDSSVVTSQDVNVTIDSMEIDVNGFDRTTRDYLSYLHEMSGPVKLKSLCAYLMTSPDHLEMMIEPVLLSKKLIQIGNSGRQLTKTGVEFLCQ